MNRLIENLKSKLRFCFNRRGLFENNAMLVFIILFVTSLIFLQVACSQAADDNSVWDKPFGSPQYLLHATGHGTMDGPRTDDWWFLNPNQPKNGFIELPDGEGGTFTYSIDQFQGPFNTPREVCAAASGKTKDNSIGGFNCKDMASQPENPSSSTNAAQYCPAECKLRNAIWNGKDEYPRCNCVCENGYDFDSNGLNCVPITSESGTSGGSSGQIQIVTPQGITSAKPGDKIQVTLPSGGQAEIRAKCQNLQATLDLINLAFDDRGRIDLHSERDEDTHMILYMIALKGALEKLHCPESDNQGNTIHKEVAESGDAPTTSSTGAVEMEIELQQGPLRAEVVDDQVSLKVDTPTATVSSDVLNDFGVAYNPNSGKSFVAAYQNPLLVKPSNSNQAPFTLGSGQLVEVSSSGIGPITTIGQTTGGSTYISPNGKDIYGPVGGKVNTQPPGMAQGSYPDLSGTWYMGGPYNVGMPCSISQDGTSLKFTNEKGDTVVGDFVNGETIEATGWNGLRGTLSADYERISWANGSWWVRQIQGRITQPSATSTEAPQGGCYADPRTGTITCVDSNGNPINTQSG